MARLRTDTRSDCLPTSKDEQATHAQDAARRHFDRCTQLLERFKALNVTADLVEHGEEQSSDEDDTFVSAIEQLPFEANRHSQQSPHDERSEIESNSEDDRPLRSRRRLAFPALHTVHDESPADAIKIRRPRRLIRALDHNRAESTSSARSVESEVAEDASSDSLGSFIVDDDASDLGSLLSDRGSPERKRSTPLVCLTPPTRLQSPSKRRVRIPTPPGRASGKDFWDAEHVNTWNDAHSPVKPLESPRKNHHTSKSPIKDKSRVSKEDAQRRKQFHQTKVPVAEAFLKELDDKITNGGIAAATAATGGVKIIWSKTLTKTAGTARHRIERKVVKIEDGRSITVIKHYSSIELAEKIIDSIHRLRNTLAHEFCHLANYLISTVKTQPHGPSFKAWGAKVTAAFADIEVTRCHTYEIEYKYIWRCDNPLCAQEYKRHSKSIDPSRQQCSICRGGLEQIRPRPRTALKITASEVENSSGEKSPSRPPVRGYAAFVQTHFADVKRSLPPGSPHKEVMLALGTRYRASKDRETSKQSSGAADAARDASPSTRVTTSRDVEENKGGHSALEAIVIESEDEAVNDVTRGISKL